MASYPYKEVINRLNNERNVRRLLRKVEPPFKDPDFFERVRYQAQLEGTPLMVMYTPGEIGSVSTKNRQDFLRIRKRLFDILCGIEA